MENTTLLRMDEKVHLLLLPSWLFVVVWLAGLIVVDVVVLLVVEAVVLIAAPLNQSTTLGTFLNASR